MATYGFDENKNKVEVYSKSEVYSKGEASSKTEMGSLSSLKTSNKSSVVAAVNECFQNASDGKSELAAAIGNGATASMTWDQIKSKVLKQKTGTIGYTQTGSPSAGFGVTTSQIVTGFSSIVVALIKIDGKDAYDDSATNITYDYKPGFNSNYKNSFNISGGNLIFNVKNDFSMYVNKVSYYIVGY